MDEDPGQGKGVAWRLGGIVPVSHRKPGRDNEVAGHGFVNEHASEVVEPRGGLGHHPHLPGPGGIDVPGFELVVSPTFDLKKAIPPGEGGSMVELVAERLQVVTQGNAGEQDRKEEGAAH